MTIASVAHVKAKFSSYVKAAGQGPVVITRNGKAVAAIVPLAEDEDMERFLLGHSPRLRAILTAGRRQARQGKAIPHDQFWQQANAKRRPKAKGRAA